MSGPFNIDDLLAATVEGLKVRGEARAIAVLIESECELVHMESDFGIDFWALYIGLPVPIFYGMEEEERGATGQAIHEIAGGFFASVADASLRDTRIVPRVVAAPSDWRDEAARFVKGEGVTNQGRVRSDNIAARQHKGLLFRSKQEITLFEALTRAGLAFAPLPVFVRRGRSATLRLEPDFIIVSNGLTFVVEVDGDTYHRELPAEADKRLLPLTVEGVEVRRIRAADLSDDGAADRAVQGLIQFMSKRKASR